MAKKYVLIISTNVENGDEHRGFVEYEERQHLEQIVFHSLDQRLGNQHIHTVTVKHDRPESGVTPYPFEDWMHALAVASKEKAAKEEQE